MANRIGQTLIKMLLMITLVIQPAVVSYAMAKMDHGSHHVSMVSVSAHDSHVAMAEDVSHDEASVLDDCCNSVACSPATTFDVVVIFYMPNPQLFSSYSPSWKGIALPTEIKPPRTFLS